MLSFKEFIKEDGETTTSSVRGLGFASGNPAVGQGHAGNYVAQNTADSDNKNNSLFLHMKQHSNEFNKVKFDSYHNQKHKKAK